GEVDHRQYPRGDDEAHHYAEGEIKEVVARVDRGKTHKEAYDEEPHALSRRASTGPVVLTEAEYLHGEKCREGEFKTSGPAGNKYISPAGGRSFLFCLEYLVYGVYDVALHPRYVVVDGEEHDEDEEGEPYSLADFERPLTEGLSLYGLD